MNIAAVCIQRAVRAMLERNGRRQRAHVGTLLLAKRQQLKQAADSRTRQAVPRSSRSMDSPNSACELHEEMTHKSAGDAQLEQRLQELQLVVQAERSRLAKSRPIEELAGVGLTNSSFVDVDQLLEMESPGGYPNGRQSRLPFGSEKAESSLVRCFSTSQSPPAWASRTFIGIQEGSLSEAHPRKDEQGAMPSKGMRDYRSLLEKVSRDNIPRSSLDEFRRLEEECNRQLCIDTREEGPPPERERPERVSYERKGSLVGGGEIAVIAGMGEADVQRREKENTVVYDEKVRIPDITGQRGLSSFHMGLSRSSAPLAPLNQGEGNGKENHFKAEDKRAGEADLAEEEDIESVRSQACPPHPDNLFEVDPNLCF